MTLTVDLEPTPDADPVRDTASPAGTTNPDDASPSDRSGPSGASDPSRAGSSDAVRGRRLAAVVVGWIVLTVVGVSLVLFGIGPLTESRDQRTLLDGYRSDIDSAANEAFGLPGIEAPTLAPAPGDPVGIVDVPTLGLRQVVLEGTDPAQTRRGPGHVVGTAGPGQPGNAVIVGRQRLFGGPFNHLGRLSEGDEIVVTTVQGVSLYRVVEVGEHRIRSGDERYAPTDDDRLTLVTSAGGLPTQADRGLVVVAELDGTPFIPTPQGGRTAEADGRRADPGAGAGLLLAVALYGAAVAVTVVAHRRTSWRSAYLLSAPILLAATIVLAEQGTRLLPGWA